MARCWAGDRWSKASVACSAGRWPGLLLSTPGCICCNTAGTVWTSAIRSGPNTCLIALRCLLLGCVGLIVATAGQGWRLRAVVQYRGLEYRGLMEHHWLWRLAEGCAGADPLPQRLRQLATSRDVASGPWLNALMGGLPEVTLRLHAVLRSQRWPLPPRLRTYATAATSLREGEVA